MTEVNRQFVLVKRPQGLPGPECIEYREGPVPEPGDGEIVVRNLYLSLDPAIRGWMDEGEGYRDPIALGAVVDGVTLGRVVKTRNPDYAEGDLVTGIHGWADYTLSPGSLNSTRVPADPPFPLTAYLGVVGPTGLTAYFGLLDVGKPQAGETVLVSAAAGAVGSIVGQIAVLSGCRAVGLAGTEAKCRWIVDELGFDAAIDYKREGDHLSEAIAKACPQGVDVYFENVGGPVLQAALDNLNVGARIPFCGAISGYNAEAPVPGPTNLWQLLVKRARFEGFLIADFAPRFGEGMEKLSAWVAEGKLRYAEDIVDGLEQAPQAFLKLFDGSHSGKLIVRIAEDA
ncbi:MAG: NADP-dependent oxidoreductase [Proteobacteria bacterium]|nr:NADP-dependent oxidoreductase [Pseudomonadota bacterium]